MVTNSPKYQGMQTTKIHLSLVLHVHCRGSAHGYYLGTDAGGAAFISDPGKARSLEGPPWLSNGPA